MYKTIISIILFTTIFISCNKNSTESKKEKKLVQKQEKKKKLVHKSVKIKKPKILDPLKIDIKYPPIAKNGEITNINVNLNNIGNNPILILSLNIQKPKLSTGYKGLEPLDAFKHEFKIGKRFSRSFNKDKTMYRCPEVHKIKEIIYPKEKKDITLKLISQKLSKQDYETVVSLQYIVLDENWDNKLYEFKGKKIEKDTVKELYVVTQKIPKKLKGSLIASSTLGNFKEKKEKIKFKLEGWLPKVNSNKIEEYAYIKSLDSWIYTDGMKSIIQNKEGKEIIFNGVNAVRTILKANMKKELHIYVHKSFYNVTKGIIGKFIKELKLIKDTDFYLAVIPSEKIPEIMIKLKKVGYGIHKGKGLKPLIK